MYQYDFKLLGPVTGFKDFEDKWKYFLANTVPGFNLFRTKSV